MDEQRQPRCFSRSVGTVAVLTVSVLAMLVVAASEAAAGPARLDDHDRQVVNRLLPAMAAFGPFSGSTTIGSSAAAKKIAACPATKKAGSNARQGLLIFGTIVPVFLEDVPKLKPVAVTANHALSSVPTAHNPTLTEWLAQIKKVVAAEVTVGKHYDASKADYCAYASDYLAKPRKANKYRLALDLGLDRVGWNAFTTLLIASSALEGPGKRLAPVLRASGYSSKQIKQLLLGAP